MILKAEFDYNFDASELTAIRGDANNDGNIDSKDIDEFTN